MPKVEGIIYKVFEQYVVLRGFAQIGDLATISVKADAYQRDADDDHKKDIIRFLEQGEYRYFPEIILAARANDYSNFLADIGSDDDISPQSGKYVNDLFIKSEYIPIRGNRARHANYEVPNNFLKRVDGNHRLEPFDKNEDDEWWSEFDRDTVSKLIVPYSIIFTNSEIANQFEAAIFNNINFKQLPLKQEKNIQNIHKYLKDTMELGDIHELTMKLVDVCESNCFKGLPPFLNPLKVDKDKDQYRTACLKIATLLFAKKGELAQSSTLEKAKDNQNIIQLKKNKLEQDLKDNSIILSEKEPIKTKLEGDLKKSEEQLNRCNKSIERLESHISEFMATYDKIDSIEVAIQSLRPVYNKMGKKEVGNLSILAALVYYKLYDESIFQSFVQWIINNGLNIIPANDVLPSHNAASLILLFEQIYERKQKEIFISMQFGDPQSEMIYEKVVQTIERFNTNRGLDIKITPIRVDQTVKAHSFTISDEILRAIEGSSLIIADLSSCNTNVYHEIGYAMGIAQGKDIEPPVILLYKTDSVFKKEGVDGDKFVGFNLRGTSQLRFSTYKELMDSLRERLDVHFSI